MNDFEWGFKRKCVLTEAKKAKAVLVRQTLGTRFLCNAANLYVLTLCDVCITLLELLPENFLILELERESEKVRGETVGRRPERLNH